MLCWRGGGGGGGAGASGCAKGPTPPSGRAAAPAAAALTEGRREWAAADPSVARPLVGAGPSGSPGAVACRRRRLPPWAASGCLVPGAGGTFTGRPWATLDCLLLLATTARALAAVCTATASSGAARRWRLGPCRALVGSMTPGSLPAGLGVRVNGRMRNSDPFTALPPTLVVQYCRRPWWAAAGPRSPAAACSPWPVRSRVPPAQHLCPRAGMEGPFDCSASPAQVPQPRAFALLLGCLPKPARWGARPGSLLASSCTTCRGGLVLAAAG